MRSPLLLALLVSVGVAAAQPAKPKPIAPAPASPKVPRVEIAFEKYSLDNGLEVILHRDPALPRVAVNLWYHVGPANEPKGRSGFAHLFEHLMFEGSKHVGARFDQLLESAGASNVNGTTNWDRTDYFETVPREHLELVLWIESDRMGYMIDSLTKQRLEVQRGIVKQERRQSFENAPYGRSSLALLDTMFPKAHPYHGAVIGSMKDLDAATFSDVKAFFRTYYAPSNATLALAGDFDGDEAKRLIQRYFGTLPKKAKPARRKFATPAFTEQKRVNVDEPVDLAKVSMGWITPPAFGLDEAPLEIAAAVLAGGKATRLYKKLVVEKQLSSEVDASLESNELASMFTVSAIAASGKQPADVEVALDEVLKELADKGPSAAELDRAKRRTLVDLMSSIQLLNGRDGESGRAGLLQRFNHYLGDPGYFPKYLDGLEQVTAEDVKRVVKKHLDPSHRVIVTTRPKPGKGKSP